MWKRNPPNEGLNWIPPAVIGNLVLSQGKLNLFNISEILFSSWLWMGKNENQLTFNIAVLVSPKKAFSEPLHFVDFIGGVKACIGQRGIATHIEGGLRLVVPSGSVERNPFTLLAVQSQTLLRTPLVACFRITTEICGQSQPCIR